MYVTVYELSTDQFYFPITTVVCFVMAIGLAYNGLEQFFEMHESGGGILKKAYHIFWIVLGLAGLIVFVPVGIESIKYGGSDKSALAIIYESGYYEVVNGVVEDFYDADKSKWFTVDGVEFTISRREHKQFGYIKNGEIVRICYVCVEEAESEEFNDDNQIVKVEILRE